MSIPEIRNFFAAPFQRTPFYAKSDFIQNQRIIGVALLALGILGTVFGVSAAMGAPALAIGGILIGASLIQQVVGNAPGCSQGQMKRVAAGICIMLGGPLGWVIGGVLWHLSNRDNHR